MCRALGRAEFTRFLQKLAVLLHMDAAALAEALLHVIGDEGQPLSLDDSATAKSMESRDAAAQVSSVDSDQAGGGCAKACSCDRGGITTLLIGLSSTNSSANQFFSFAGL